MKKVLKFCKNNLTLMGVIVIVLFSVFFVEGFRSLYNIRSLIASIAPLAVVSCGVTLPVLYGGTDFSATSMVTLGSVLVAWFVVKTPMANTIAGNLLAILIIIAIGALLGAFNGVSVAIFKMPAFIATMAMQMAIAGVAVLFSTAYFDTVSLSGLPSFINSLGGGSGYNLFTPLIIAGVIIVFTQWLLTRTVFGRQVYAVGTNQKAAFISGVKHKRIIITLQIMSGLYAGIAAVLYTAKNQAGIPTMGDTLWLDVMASIIIGGTSVAGGKGGCIKTLYGSVFIVTMNSMLNLMGITWYVTILIKGLLMLILLLAENSGERFVKYFKRTKKTDAAVAAE